MPKRRSDVLEAIAERFLLWFLGGSVLLAFAVLLYRFRGEGTLMGLFWVVLLSGATSVTLAVVAAWEVRKVTSFSVKCPYCEEINVLTEKPERDFTCVH